MKISKAVRSDVKSLLKIEQEVFKGDDMAIKLSSFYYHLKNNEIYKIEIKKELVGYILWLERKEFYRLYSLAISDKCRGLGLASKLLEYSIKKLKYKNMQLEVRKSNVVAIKLYEKFGFKIKKELENFYDDEDGLLMRLKR